MPNQNQLSIHDKMLVVFDAVINIQKAESEQQAILQAMLHMERLNYPHVMISFLQKVGQDKFIIADPGFSTGDKWKQIAERTIRPYEKQEDLLPRVLKSRIPRNLRR